MAVNKNFTVRHGLEVNTSLILADANTNKVGIGSTGPRFELDVAGGIGATDFYLSGIGTFVNELNVGTDGSVLTALGVGGSVGVGTALPAYLLDIRSATTTGTTALYVQGDVQITGDLSVDDITFDDASVNNLTVIEALNVTSPGISTFGGYVDINDNVDISGTLNVGGATTLGGYVDINSAADFSSTVNISGITTVGGYADFNSDVDISGTLNVTGIATIATISVVGAELTNLNVTGITTLGTVQVSSGIVTATTGIVTYYGDGSQLDGVIGGIGINTEGGLVGFGITYLHLFGAGVSTTFYDQSVGIATIFLEGGGGGGGGSVSISSVAPLSPSNGDLWYNIDYGRTFVYYDEVALGIGATAVWVDAAPFNQGINAVLAGVAFSTGSATSPSLYFEGDAQTGFFSPAFGEFTIVSAASSILNVNSGGINVTGIVTAVDFDSLSDINYKENVETIENALDKVSNIRGVKFDWKESGQKSYGVIAQELENVLPELVHGENPRVVNYNGIIGVLIEAIKELKDEVYQLKNSK